ncbi:MAG: hypothetical protein ACE5ID_09415, partial [Acidobacteriota bacterium]
ERAPRRVLMGMGCYQTDPVEYNACLTRKGLDLIRTAPGRFLRRIPTKVADLFNPTSFLVRHIRRGLYGPWPKGLADTSVLLVALFNMGLMILAVVGWQEPTGTPARRLLGILLVYMLVIHSITFGMSRFRLPLEPWMAVGAGLFLAAPARSLKNMIHGPRRLFAGLLLAGLLLGWLFRVGGLFYEPPGGRPEPKGALSAGPSLLASLPPVHRMIHRVRAMSMREGPGKEPSGRPPAGVKRRRGAINESSFPTSRENRARQNPLARARRPVRETSGPLPFLKATTSPTMNAGATGLMSNFTRASPLVM